METVEADGRVGRGGRSRVAGAKMIKEDVERARPGTYLEHFVRRATTPSDGLGFVSGHSAVAFALAAVVSPCLSRKGRSAAYAVATIVAFARIHVGARFPLDTVGGASLEIALAMTYHLVVGVPADVAAERQWNPLNPG